MALSGHDNSGVPIWTSIRNVQLYFVALKFSQVKYDICSFKILELKITVFLNAVKIAASFCLVDLLRLVGKVAKRITAD